MDRTLPVLFLAPVSRGLSQTPLVIHMRQGTCHAAMLACMATISDWCGFYNADVKALEALQIAKQLRASLAAMEGAKVSTYLSAEVSALIFQHHCMRLLLPGVGMTHVYQPRAPLWQIGS